MLLPLQSHIVCYSYLIVMATEIEEDPIYGPTASKKQQLLAKHHIYGTKEYERLLAVKRSNLLIAAAMTREPNVPRPPSTTTSQKVPFVFACCIAVLLLYLVYVYVLLLRCHLRIM
jgi:hypothetical protein